MEDFVPRTLFQVLEYFELNLIIVSIDAQRFGSFKIKWIKSMSIAFETESCLDLNLNCGQWRTHEFISKSSSPSLIHGSK